MTAPNQKISDLTEQTTPAGTDELVIVRGGGNYRMTHENLVSKPVGSDMVISGDAAGVLARLAYGLLYTPSTITDDFNAGSLGGNWAWAGAPFVTPTVLIEQSVLKVSFSSSNRAFLVRSGGISTIPIAAVRAALYTSTVGQYCGVRFDDGTDDNYVELCLTYNASNSWIVESHVRTGGGTPTNTTQVTIGAFPAWYILQLYLAGTKWSTWSATGLYSINSPGNIVFSITTGLTWTPTREGLIFKYGGAAWQQGCMDWYTQT